MHVNGTKSATSKVSGLRSWEPGETWNRMDICNTRVEIITKGLLLCPVQFWQACSKKLVANRYVQINKLLYKFNDTNLHEHLKYGPDLSLIFINNDVNWCNFCTVISLDETAVYSMCRGRVPQEDILK